MPLACLPIACLPFACMPAADCGHGGRCAATALKLCSAACSCCAAGACCAAFGRGGAGGVISTDTTDPGMLSGSWIRLPLPLPAAGAGPFAACCGGDASGDASGGQSFALNVASSGLKRAIGVAGPDCMLVGDLQ